MATRSAVIIGGGVIGTASAYYLSQAGWRVTVLDQARAGAACSHANCGYVCPSHVLPLAAPGAMQSTLRTLLQRNSPLKLSPWQLFKNLRWFLGFARKCNATDMRAAAVGIRALLVSSRNLYDELLTTEQLACEWQAKGLYFVFRTAEAFEHYSHIDEMLKKEFDTHATRYDATEFATREPAIKPDAVSGAYCYEWDAQLRPDRLMTSWRAAVERMGGTFVENAEFQGFAGSSSQATVARTAVGEFSADAFVVATGAWTPKLNAQFGCRVPIVPGKGYSLTMPRPSICPKVPMIFEEDRVAVSPFDSGYRVGSMMEFTGYDSSINPKRLEYLRTTAARYLRDPHPEPLQEQWFGWRPMVYDGKPIIDRTPAWGNVVVAAGHGMLGLSMAPGTGKLVTELLSDAPPHVDASAYSFARFK